jgi:hypothetical protein
MCTRIRPRRRLLRSTACRCPHTRRRPLPHTRDRRRSSCRSSSRPSHRRAYIRLLRRSFPWRCRWSRSMAGQRHRSSRTGRSRCRQTPPGTWSRSTAARVLRTVRSSQTRRPDRAHTPSRCSRAAWCRHKRCRFRRCRRGSLPHTRIPRSRVGRFRRSRRKSLPRNRWFQRRTCCRRSRGSPVGRRGSRCRARRLHRPCTVHRRSRSVPCRRTRPRRRRGWHPGDPSCRRPGRVEGGRRSIRGVFRRPHGRGHVCSQTTNKPL